jgi:hypothetical protein
MSLHNLLDFLLTKLPSLFRKPLLQLFLSNKTSVMNIESMENGESSFIRQIFFYIDCGGKELAVVDHVIIRIVDLLYDLLDFGMAHMLA